MNKTNGRSRPEDDKFYHHISILLGIAMALLCLTYMIERDQSVYRYLEHTQREQQIKEAQIEFDKQEYRDQERIEDEKLMQQLQLLQGENNALTN